GHADLRLRPRQRHHRRAARDHALRGRTLSALDAAARGERGMSALADCAARTRDVERPRRDWVLVGLWVALVVVALVWLAPFVFIVFTSLKSNAQVMASSAFAPPADPQYGNYAAAWTRGRFGTTVFNSVVITFVKVPLGLFISAMAAYALARMRIPGGKLILIGVLFGTMIPFQVMLAPLFTLVNGLHLIDTYPGVILPYIAFGIPYQVFILHGFFRGIPNELSEAARIDSASHVTIFLRIFLPLSLPVLAALMILDFVATWNEFAMALVL